MAASAVGLDRIVIDIAPGANPQADPSTFTWELAGRRRTASDIVIQAGRDDEATDVEAGSLSATMDDRDGNLSPRNVYGQWYGKLSRGCPIRVRWARTTDNFTRTVAAGGWGTNTDGYAWTIGSSSSSFSVDGSRAVVQLAFNGFSRNLLTGAGSADVDVTWSVTAPVLPTGGNFVSAAVLRSVGTTYLLANAELQTDSTIMVKIGRFVNGSITALTSNTVVGSYTAGAKVRVRARAEGAFIMIKAWLDSGAEPAAWQLMTTDYVAEGTGVGMVLWRLNSNAGTYTAYIDDYAVDNVLWVGNVPEWAPRWPDKSGEDSVTPITAAGVLRRIQQGSSQLQSPLRRQLTGLPYASGYWPLEDEGGSLSAASAVPKGRPAQTGGEVTFAGDDSLPGASTTLVLNDAFTSSITGTAPIKTTTGWSAMVLFKMDTATAVGVDQTLFELRTTGTAVRWRIWVLESSAIGFQAYDASDTLIASGSGGADAVNFLSWTAVQIETNISGGTVTVSLLWHQVGSENYYVAVTGGPYSYSGTAPAITSMKVVAPTNKLSVGHMWIGDDILPFVDANFSLVSNGYIGESASSRITRVAAESGIPVGALTGASEPMGRQKEANLLDLLRETEDADQGVLYERGNSLAYRPRSRRYNNPPTMALDWSLGHLDEPPEPQDDDQRLRNQWTVERVDGSSAVALDQASIDLVGLYDDSAELNIAHDDRLGDFASWLLHLGTADELRWPRIKINLVAHPELISQWLACTIGSRITIANPPSQIAGESIDLIIEGYTQTINLHKWTVELSCSPARPWDVGVYDSTARRYDSRTTTLQSSVTSSATSMSFTFTNPADYWSRNAAAQPYDVMVQGERIRIPVGGMGAVTGTGPYTQAVTGATRAINGISKALAANAAVHVATPGRYAL